MQPASFVASMGLKDQLLELKLRINAPPFGSVSWTKWAVPTVNQVLSPGPPFAYLPWTKFRRAGMKARGFLDALGNFFFEP